MDKIKKIKSIRKNLSNGKFSIGSWMQVGDSDIAEIMGKLNYDWVAIDLEHGQINLSSLPDIFRALELGGTLPFVRISKNSDEEIKHVLDSGASGLIIPQIENVDQLEIAYQYSCYPPSGKRGVGFSRTNLFGKNFDTYKKEAQRTFIVPMIESQKGIENIDQILQLKFIDAIMVGPYDLSASIGVTGRFEDKKFKKNLKQILSLCSKNNVACGLHVVKPEIKQLDKAIKEGYQFLAYAGDAFFLNEFATNPISKEK